MSSANRAHAACRRVTSRGCQWAVVVAVIAVRVMKVAADTVVCVIAVRNRLMAAAGTVDMARLMATATMARCAAVRILARHFNHVLVDVTFVRVVEVTIMQVVDVAAVTDGGVAAARPMLVSMVGMDRCGAGRHGVTSFPCPGFADTVVRLSVA
jgi:hypothetical protein